jgi:hypothetical protein
MLSPNLGMFGDHEFGYSKWFIVFERVSSFYQPLPLIMFLNNGQSAGGQERQNGKLLELKRRTLSASRLARCTSR